MLIRATIPRDTSRDAWDMQVSVLERMGPERRVDAAIDLSEFVRSLYLAGIRSRHPGWSDEDVVRHVVWSQYGVDLPGRP
jgi:hypothetical protein